MRTRYGIPKNEDDFEILCLKLLRRKWGTPRLAQYGKRGQRQFGIDLIDLDGAELAKAAQCKLHEPHKVMTPTEVETEVAKAKGAPFRLGMYLIATTATPSTDAQRSVFEINQSHRKEGLFHVELLHWREIEDLLDEYTDVREEVYGGLDAEQVRRISSEVRDSFERTATLIADRFRLPLEEAKQALEEHDFPVAKRVLERLKKQHWDELNSLERFQLLSRLAVVKFYESALDDAAELFLKAKAYRPDDEKALINEAFAYFIRGDSTTAHKIAGELRSKYPHSTQLASIWVNSAPESTDPDTLIGEMDPSIVADAEVAVALGNRFMQLGDSERAESILRAATRGKLEWPVLPFTTARALFSSELKAAARLGDREQTERTARLKDAEQLFSQALDLAKKQRDTRLAAECLLDRAQVRRITCEDKAADADVEQAFSLAPDEPTAIAQMAELHRRRGNADRSVEMLDRAHQLSPSIGNEYLLASALRARGKAGDYARAAELMREVALATPKRGLLIGGREHAISIVIECLGREGRWEDAKKMLNELPSGFLDPVAMAALNANVALSQHRHELANNYASEALSLSSSETDRDSLAYLARLLNDLGRHKEALPIWQKVVRPGEFGPDPRHLLDTARRLGKHDIILETCERLRKAGVSTPYLIDYEVAVLEHYDIATAIRVLQEYLGDNPDDAIARLRLSSLGLRLKRNDLVDAQPSHMPAVAEAQPEVGLMAVRVMKMGGFPEAALEYGYELLRRHFSDPVAHRAYTLALLPLGPKPVLREFSTAERGTAVCYVEDNVAGQHWKVIEDPPAGAPRFHDEIPTTSKLALELADKKVGQKFTLAPSSISPRMATIVQILNKYVYRYQDCMEQWQVRFPESPDVQSIHLPRRDSDGELDVSEILKAVDRRHDATKEIEQIYRTMPVPIHMFAAQVGKTAFEGLQYLASNAQSTVFCCAGTTEERESAFEAVRKGTSIVLDLTAIASLIKLGCPHILRSLSLSPIVSQSTLSELQDLLTQEEASDADGGVIAKTDSGYVIVERSERDREAQILALSQIIELLKSVATIMPCRELAALDPAKRETLDKAFGRYGAESIILASTPGRVLWTDDARQAGFAKTEHGVRRIWTQAILQLCLERGSLTPEEYFDSSAKLLGFGYLFTSSNAEVLLAACKLAGWSVDERPLKHALDEFKAEYIDSSAQVQLTASFLLRLYREPLPLETRDRVFLRILDNLATKHNGIEGILAIQEIIPRLFKLNVVGAEQCSACIKRWLQSRSLNLYGE